MASIERDPARLFAAPGVRLSQRADGAMLLSSPQPLGAYRRCVGEDLEHWASSTPQQLEQLIRNDLAKWQRVVKAAGAPKK